MLVDDEINGLKSLELVCKQLDKELEIVSKTTDPVEAITLINTYRPNIVFMDISMPELNGFEVLEKLRFREFFLVFTTAHKNYALQALKQGATDYLLKPIDVREVRKTIEKIKLRILEKTQMPDVYEILKHIGLKRSFRINLPTKTSLEYVFPSSIIYLKAESNYTLVYLTNGEHVEVIKSLGSFEELLCNNELHFIRVHNSYIINIDYITRYIKDDGGFVVMNGKKTIPVSRQKKAELLKSIDLPL